MFLRIPHHVLLLFSIVSLTNAEEKLYDLEALCGSHRDLRVSNTTSFTVRAGNDTLPSCLATLNVRWETQQAFWVTVTVRRFSFTSRSASGKDRACQALQPIKLVSYDGIRSILGPTEFSVRFFSSVQLQYSRTEQFENSDLDMTITVEPFELEERAEWFNRHNYHNVSLEEFCGQSLFENVSDGSVRWELNVMQPPWKTEPDSICSTAFNFHTTNFSDPHFVTVGLPELNLELQDRRSQMPCLSRNSLSIRGAGWVHTVTPACSVPTLMRHSGITTISYTRREPFKDTMNLKMTIRLNDGDYFVTDKEYAEESSTEKEMTTTEAKEE